MYKIVIADDELLIIQLLEKLIDYERFSVQVVGTATDGMSAWMLVKELKPDILITDIKMPCMDGLELIEHINQSNTPVSIIAISGYRRFDYAYNALKSGVEDYLVKPISKKDLNEALEKVCAMLAARNPGSEADAESGRKGVAQTRSALIADCFAGKERAESLEEINARYMVSFQPGCFAGLAIRIDPAHSDGIYESIHSRCADTLRENLKDLCWDMEFSAAEGYYCGVVNMSAGSVAQFLRRLKALFENLHVSLDGYGAVAISIGVGEIVSEGAKIAPSLRQAKDCARVKCILGGNRIYFSENLSWEGANAQLLPVQIESLRKVLEVGRTEQLQAWLDGVFSKPMDYYAEHPLEALSLIDSAIGNFFMLCEMLAIPIDDGAKEDCAERMNCVRGLNEAVGCMQAFMQHVVQTDRKNRAQRSSYPVQRAMEYIQDKLNVQMRLEDIAEYVMLSPNYLSMLFKKETGQGISDFILQLRLERAKLLLRTTSLNISQIAEKVGYQDARHFSKLFRKMTGIQPKDYRKMYFR